MATYVYGTRTGITGAALIKDLDVINFKPGIDTLAFGDATFKTTTLATDLSISESGADLIFTDFSNGKSFTLQNTVLTQLPKIVFSSGSILIIGDGTTNTVNDANANALTGGAKEDYLDGQAGNDTLDGKGGADILIGGDGNDTYIVDNVDDQVNENQTDPSIGGIDSVQSTVSYSLNVNVENLQLYVGTTVSTTDIDGTGNYLDNKITGNDGKNNLQGLDGNDRIVGNNGADTLNGGTGSDTLIGGNGNDTYVVDTSLDVVIETSAGTAATAGGIDTVMASVSYSLDTHLEKLILTGIDNINGTGNKLSNVIIGNDGNNILDGKGGADSFDGGKGNDTYIVNSIDDAVSESTIAVAQLDLLKLQQSRFSYNPADFSDIDLIKTTVDYTLPENIEQLQLLGSANLKATGNALNNVFYANVGDNTFDGVSGSDTVSYQPYQAEILAPNSLVGASAALAGVTVSLASAAAQNTRGSGFDTLLNIDNLVGSQYNDILTGNTAANILDGGAGADLLKGGGGNDAYIVDSGDVVVEAAGAGTDTVYASMDYILPVNVERLTLIGLTAINGIGNTLNNILIGNEFANTLDGSGGADRLEGRGGDDRYVIDGGDTVVEAVGAGIDTVVAINLSVSSAKPLAANVENLQLIGSIALTGYGNNLPNIIYANTGNSNLNGGANDIGYTDTVSYEYGANAGVTIDLSLTIAQATGGSGSDTLVGFDHVIGSVYDDLLIGTAASNIINGSGGTDTVSYAKESNRIVVNLGIVDTLGQSQGFATSYNIDDQPIFTDILQNIENVTGTSKDDMFTLNAADNVIDGGLGIDTVSYEASITAVNANLAITGEQTPAPGYNNVGYDTLTNIENLIGSFFNDTLTGNAGNNVLRGAIGNGVDGADILIGGAGNDTLIGDIGADTLTGGTGKDTFRYVSVNETRAASDNPAFGIDTITDFKQTEGDKVDLSPLRPDANQISVFNFLGLGTATSALAVGDLNYYILNAGTTSTLDDTTVIRGIDDNATEFSIILTGNISLAATDFNL